MQNIQLIPLTQDPQQLSSWANENFRRIVDGLANVSDMRMGTTVVTGSLSISTGLVLVQFAMATMYDDPPSNNAILVTAKPGPTNSQLTVKVWGYGAPNLVLSTVPITVTWAAYGF